MKIKTGDEMQYNQAWAGGNQSGGTSHRRVPVKIINPVSPHAKGCALVALIGAKHPFDGPFNAELASLS